MTTTEYILGATQSSPMLLLLHTPRPSPSPLDVGSSESAEGTAVVDGGERLGGGVGHKRPLTLCGTSPAGDRPGRGPVASPWLAGVVLFFVARRRALASVLFMQELLSTGVAPRTGVGLVHAMLQHPDAHGQEEVQLVVRCDNATALAFYERLDFEPLVDAEAERRAFEPLRDQEVCLSVRRATLVKRTESLLGACAPLAYVTHQSKAAFVMRDMWRFKEVVATLQVAHRARASTTGALPGDPRVRYVVAALPTQSPRDTTMRDAI